MSEVEFIDRVCYTDWMTATAHAIIGGAIAASTPTNPTLGITLTAMSHPILDMVPHWDFGLGWKKKNKGFLFFQSSADLIFGIIITFLLFGRFTDNLYLLLAIFISESWDLMIMPYLLFNWKFPPFSTFYNVQHALNNRANFFWGIFTQAATVTGIVAFALRTTH